MGSSNDNLSIRPGEVLAEKAKRLRLNAKVGVIKREVSAKSRRQAGADPEAEVSATSRRSDKAATSLRSPCKTANSVAGREWALMATSAVTAKPTSPRSPWWSGFIVNAAAA